MNINDQNLVTLESIHFRSVKFSPEVIIKIDYRGKMVDKGSVVGFLTSILQVNQSRVVLRRINSRRGLALDLVYYQVFRTSALWN